MRVRYRQTCYCVAALLASIGAMACSLVVGVPSDVTLGDPFMEAGQDGDMRDAPRDAPVAADAPSVDAADAGGNGDSDAAQAPPLPASCATSDGGGIDDCAGTRGSCCASDQVDGGTYFRTYSYDGGGALGLADPATVSSLRVDRYEVTVARFRQYVSFLTSAAGGPPSNGSGKHSHINGGQGLALAGTPTKFESGWDALGWNGSIPSGASAADKWTTNLLCDANYATWTPKPGINEKAPINCLTWYEAYAFCIWDGGFLPSEAEWEYAAAGGDEQRLYPWGPTNPGVNNQYAIYTCAYPSSSGTCTSTINIASVGTATRGVGRYGQLDLAGSIWEWARDSAGSYTTCFDCVDDVPAATEHVVRGGAFNTQLKFLPSASRSSYTSSSRDPNTGVRCARAP